MNKLPFALIASLALCACSDPTPTPTPDPPEPQTAAAASEGEHTELRDAIQEPLDKAQSVEVTLQESAAQRDQQLEESGD